MAETPQEEALTEYERAVCYYSLPRLVSPISYALIVAYGVCLLEAFAAMFVGIIARDEQWRSIGATAAVVMLTFGLIVFSGRAFLNDFRRKKLLAEARNAPPPAKMHARDVPDPFASHVLVQHPDATRGNFFTVSEAGTDHAYVVTLDAAKKIWTVSNSDGSERFRVDTQSGLKSFSFGPQDLPSRLGVFRGDKEIARIRNRSGLRHPRTEIKTLADDQSPVYVRADGIYCDDRLVGRIYRLRHAYYLDVEKEFFSDPLLAFFITVA